MKAYIPAWLVAVVIVMALWRSPRKAWLTPLCVFCAVTLLELLTHSL